MYPTRRIDRWVEIVQADVEHPGEEEQLMVVDMHEPRFDLAYGHTADVPSQ